ncbi:hypothetical protein FPQ18DRAFT_392693 [Pyronema domesticum]|uniref:Uncharacterized protein n=1 Tax=Pyronema omphalodes (strain CBS 100304) TaxID=1076935 RepID=U4LQV8_PYROM|nr:hypothetical protein FPQ18DRAFT_392693 [Pyronema domesticum]CCX31720.1 Protein of unknown function [Pyronema omphalodes CBS 100304]
MPGKQNDEITRRRKRRENKEARERDIPEPHIFRPRKNSKAAKAAVAAEECPSLTFTTSEAVEALSTDNTDTDNVAASTFAPEYDQAGIPTAISTPDFEYQNGLLATTLASTPTYVDTPAPAPVANGNLVYGTEMDVDDQEIVLEHDNNVGVQAAVEEWLLTRNVPATAVGSYAIALSSTPFAAEDNAPNNEHFGAIEFQAHQKAILVFPHLEAAAIALANGAHAATDDDEATWLEKLMSPF